MRTGCLLDSSPGPTPRNDRSRAPPGGSRGRRRSPTCRSRAQARTCETTAEPNRGRARRQQPTRRSPSCPRPPARHETSPGSTRSRSQGRPTHQLQSLVHITTTLASQFDARGSRPSNGPNAARAPRDRRNLSPGIQHGNSATLGATIAERAATREDLPEPNKRPVPEVEEAPVRHNARHQPTGILAELTTWSMIPGDAQQQRLAQGQRPAGPFPAVRGLGRGLRRARPAHNPLSIPIAIRSLVGSPWSRPE